MGVFTGFDLESFPWQLLSCAPTSRCAAIDATDRPTAQAFAARRPTIGWISEGEFTMIECSGFPPLTGGKKRRLCFDDRYDAAPGGNTAGASQFT